MKTISLAYFLSAFALTAQVPPVEDPDAAARDAALRQALEQRIAQESATDPATAVSAEVDPTATPPTEPVAEPATEAGSATAESAPPVANPPAVAPPRTTIPSIPRRPRTTPAAGAAPVVPAPRAPGAATTTAPVAGAPDIGPDTIAITPSSSAGKQETIAAGQINFVSAKLEQVMKIYAELVGKTILRPSSLSSPDIILTTQTDLTKSEAIQALDAVLLMNGVAMVDMGEKFVKAVPVAQAPQTGKPTGDQTVDELPELGPYVIQVVQTKFVKPSELQQVLQQFANLPNSILPIDTSQILVLRDSAENVRRMVEMVEKVDIEVPSEFVSEVIPIKYALAADIANALNSLASGGGGTTVGSSRGATGSTRNLGRTSGATGSRFGQQGFGGIGTQYGGQYGGYTPQASVAAPATPSSGAGFSDRLRQIINRAATPGGAAGDIEVIGTTKIIADERMNALLVFATREDMKTIKDIVEKLDVVLAQVLIETIIMDVSLDDTVAIGVSAAQTPKDFNSVFSGAGGVNLQRFTDVAGGGSTGGGTNQFTDLIGSGLRYFGKFNENYYVQLQAAASKNKVNVIQKPRIQTSHATPASIFIGSTVPYVTGTYYGGFGGGPGSQYQQLRVGIGLDVTPFINPDGLVVMQINESIDEISGSTQIENVGAVPNTTSRTLSAEVAVRDGETIILGGFIRDSDTATKSGVPFLQDIPLLGYLFRSTGKAKERKELIVLMRPTVLRTPELAAAHVEVEKERLPGVLSAEREIMEFEKKAVEQARKEKFSKPTPMTPEEIENYGTQP